MHAACKGYASFIFLIIRRFIKSPHKSPYHTCLALAFVAVGITCGVITFIDSMINGMHRETIAALKGMHADIKITLPPDADIEKIVATLKTVSPHIAAIDVIGVHHVLVHHEPTLIPATVITLSPTQSILPVTQWLASHNKTPIKGNRIALGHDLAQALDCEHDDKIQLIFSGTMNNDTCEFQHCFVKVHDYLQSNIDEVDQHIVCIDAHAFENLTGIAPFTHIILKTTKSDNKTLTEITQSIKKTLGLTAHTWMESHRSVAQALALERTCTSIMLALLLILGSVTSFSLLFIFLSEKTRYLAALLTLGAPIWTIRCITLLLSAATLITASSIGCNISSLIAWTCDRYHLIPLPASYYQTYLPLDPCLKTSAILIFFHLLIGIGAGLWTTRNLTHNSIHGLAKEYQ